MRTRLWNGIEGLGADREEGMTSCSCNYVAVKCGIDESHAERRENPSRDYETAGPFCACGISVPRERKLRKSVFCGTLNVDVSPDPMNAGYPRGNLAVISPKEELVKSRKKKKRKDIPYSRRNNSRRGLIAFNRAIIKQYGEAKFAKEEFIDCELKGSEADNQVKRELSKRERDKVRHAKSLALIYAVGMSGRHLGGLMYTGYERKRTV